MKRALLLIFLASPSWATYQVIYSGVTGSTSGMISATRYIAVQGGAECGFTSTENDVKTLFTSSGTLKAMYIQVAVAPGASKSLTFTMRKNNNPTSMVVTISGTSTVGVSSGTAVWITNNALDGFAISAAGTGTPADPLAVYIATLWDSTETGRSNHSQVSCGNFTNSAARYGPLGGASVWNATESNTQGAIPSTGTIVAIGYHIEAAAGLGKSWTLAVDKGGSSIGSCTAANTTSCLIDGLSVRVKPGDLLNYALTPTGTPTATDGAAAIAFVPDNIGEFFSVGNSYTGVTSTTTYHCYLQSGNCSGTALHTSDRTANLNINPIPNVVINGAWIHFRSAPAGAASWTVQLRNTNVANMNHVMTVSGTATEGSVWNLQDLPSDGQPIDWQFTPTGSPAASGWNVGLRSIIRRNGVPIEDL